MLFGVGKRVNNFVYLFLDAMIGGGVVYDGDVLRGTNSNAGGLAPVSYTHLTLPTIYSV